jgi:hypothetical protein
MSLPLSVGSEVEAVLQTKNKVATLKAWVRYDAGRLDGEERRSHPGSDGRANEPHELSRRHCYDTWPAFTLATPKSGAK